MESSKQKNQTILYVIKLLLLLMTTCIYVLIWYCFYAEKSSGVSGFKLRAEDVIIFLIFFILYGCFSKLYGVFDLKVSRISDLVYSNITAILVTSVLIYCITALKTGCLPNVLPVILFVMLAVPAGIVWSIIANRETNRVLGIQSILMIYDNEDARRNGEKILKSVPWRYRMLDQVQIKNNIDETLKEIDLYEPYGVMLCGIHSSPRNLIVKYCMRKDIPIYIRPNIGDFIISSASEIQLANLPVVLCERAQITITYRVVKRMMDIVFSLIGLFLSSPIMFITALAVKAYDQGPILYKQVRLTKDGREFYIYKFRSMKVNAEADGVARLAAKEDERITPVGRIIRAVRIDELPQIFCILKGDMSIVGPRPERPEISAEYEKVMPEFALRLQVKAGLTGYAQVYGKYNTEPYDKLQMDLMYIARQGLVTDLKIMLATIKILFIPESTEGVAAGQRTAGKNE